MASRAVKKHVQEAFEKLGLKRGAAIVRALDALGFPIVIFAKKRRQPLELRLVAALSQL